MATNPTPLMSLEQFGQTIKVKYPQYSDMADGDVGSSVLAKYPQYGDMVAPAVPAAPLPAGLQGPASAPVAPSTDNWLQRKVDIASAPDSPQVRAQESPVQNAMSAFGQGAAQTFVQPLVHPLQTLKGIGQTAAETSGFGPAAGKQGPITQAARSTVQDFQQKGSVYAIPHTLGQGAGMLLGSEAMGGLGEAAKTAAPATSEFLRTTGGTLVDRAAGSIAKDFKHGALPGRSYLEGGGTPALTVSRLAQQAGDVKSNAGSKIGGLYRTATDSGVKIPTETVASALNPPIQNALRVANGPGGNVGSIPTIEEHAASFRPLIQQGVQNGGLTPLDIFGAKRNIAQSTAWSDPTQLGMKGIRQANVGALGSVLQDAIPEVKQLNSIYQGAGNLANRAALRASTGSSPLTQIGRRVLEGGFGSAVGAASHNPIFGTAAAAIPMAVDSTPGLTGLGYGAFKTGNLIEAGNPLIPPILRGVGAASGVQTKTKNKN